jgi:hypothetical protein
MLFFVTKIECHQHILRSPQYENVNKIHPEGNVVVPCGQTEKQEDMTNLTVTVCNWFANLPRFVEWIPKQCCRQNLSE